MEDEKEIFYTGRPAGCSAVGGGTDPIQHIHILGKHSDLL